VREGDAFDFYMEAEAEDATVSLIAWSRPPYVANSRPNVNAGSAIFLKVM
jgi:hypothetical protein